LSLYDRLLALTGVIPPFLLLWLAEAAERRIREPTKGYRYRVFAAAGLASVPIVWVEHSLSVIATYSPSRTAGLFDAFVVSASVEECGKAVCLFLLTRGALAPRTRYGAFLYALHASMGFALVENVIALLQTPDIQAFSDRFFLRAYFSVPVHLVATGLLGIFWARRRFDRGAVGLLGGLAIAVAIHGTFNALLFTIDNLSAEDDTLRIVCAATAMAIPLLGAPVLRRLSLRLRTDDRRDEASTERRAPNEPPRLTIP